MPVANVKISVVTPFFNEAEFLATCIESVLAQTHGDLEYILVDNHSTDGSAEIAEGYARKDDRVRIVRPPQHLNQLPNHDFGLCAISPDAAYCKVVQGDDWIYPHCLELLAERALAHPSAGMVSAFTLLEDAVYLTGLHPDEPFVGGHEIARRFLRDGLYVFGSPTAHIFRADVVRGRRPFYREEAHPFADVDACLLTLRQTDFAFVPQVLSFTRRSNESITTQRRRWTNTMLLTRYVMLLHHGSSFFEREELDACHRQLSAQYYRSLGESFWRILPRDFWKLQKGCLEAAGARLRTGRAAAAVLLELLELLLNPLSTARRIAARGTR